MRKYQLRAGSGDKNHHQGELHSVYSTLSLSRQRAIYRNAPPPSPRTKNSNNNNALECLIVAIIPLPLDTMLVVFMIHVRVLSNFRADGPPTRENGELRGTPLLSLSHLFSYAVTSHSRCYRSRDISSPSNARESQEKLSTDCHSILYKPVSGCMGSFRNSRSIFFF